MVANKESNAFSTLKIEYRVLRSSWIETCWLERWWKFLRLISKSASLSRNGDKFAYIFNAW